MPARLCLLLLLAAGVLAGCGKRENSSRSSASASDRSTLHLGNGAEPATLDPHLGVKLLEYNIMIALFEGLTVSDEATSLPRSGMAEKWDITPDGLVYTFHLRNATWSNGDSVTADDFAFSYERILNPVLGSPYSYMLYAIKGAEDYNLGKTKSFDSVGVRALDPKTLEITLGAPTPYLLALAAHQAWFPVHKQTILKHGGVYQRDTKWIQPGNLVGNGAFLLDEWKLNRHIAVKKNPRYWDAGTGRIERVVFHPIDDPVVEERNFRTGQLHVTDNVPIDRVGFYRQQSPSPLRVDPLLSINYLRFNVTRAPFDNPKVRQALSYAIDRRGLVSSVLHDTRLPAYSLVPPNTAGYNSTARIDVDYPRAKRLLAEAGFPDGRGFPKVEVQYSQPVVDTKVLEALQEIWRRELGIELTLALLDNRVHISNQHSLDFQISASRWVGDYNDPSTFTDLMTSESGNNDTGWKNPAYDKLVAEAARQADGAARFALLQQAEALCLEEAAISPLFIGTRLYLAQPNVKNWVPSLLGIHRYQTIHIE